MILGIGVDSVEIKRFTNWRTFPEQSLQRIFSLQEIEYCLNCPKKSAERFAARFAAREALFKALSSAYPNHIPPFLTVCRAVSIQRAHQGFPQLIVDWPMLRRTPNHLPTIHLSWTHTATTATAITLLEGPF